jgi:hypothetical protein
MSLLGEINSEYLTVFVGATFIVLAMGAFSHATWMRKGSTRTVTWAYLLWSLLLFFCLFGGALWDIEQTAFLHYWSVPLLIASSFIYAPSRDYYQPVEKMLAMVPLVLLMPVAYVIFFLFGLIAGPVLFFSGKLTSPLLYLQGLLSLVVPYVVTYAVAVLASRAINAPRGARLGALRRSPFK